MPHSESSGKTALITGASSGFGLLTSVTLARRGWHVLATMRDLTRREKLEKAAREAGVMENIEIHTLDVTRAEQIASLSRSIANRGSPLHALVNNAGFAVPGFAEGVTDAELREQFDTNFFGATAVTRAFLPQMIQQKFGHIIMVSSVWGQAGFPGMGSYAASKFALEGWSESLRFEMKALGIHIVLLEPGPHATDTSTRSAKPSAWFNNLTPAEATRVERWKSKLQLERQRADPQIVADTMAMILEKGRPKFRYTVGPIAKTVLLMRRVLPWSVWERWLSNYSGTD